MRRGQHGSRSRTGGIILHPVVLAVVFAGVAVWLGLFFAVESTQGVVEAVVAILLVAFSLWLGYFVVVAVAAGAVLFGIRLLIDRVEQEKRRRLPRAERDKADLRYVYLAVAPLLVVVLLVGFGSGFAFGYMAGGVFWGIYAAALTACVIAASWVLAVRR